MLVFRQTLPFKYARESGGEIWSQAKSFNAHNNSAPNFSILDQLEGFRSHVDGKLKLKLIYPDDSNRANVWKQSSNPVTRTTGCVEGYEAVDVAWTENSWGGLEHSDCDQTRPNGGQCSQCGSSFLDGSVDSCQFFFAIALTADSAAFSGTIPGPSDNRGFQKVELFAWSEGDHASSSAVT